MSEVNLYLNGWVSQPVQVNSGVGAGICASVAVNPNP